MWQKESKVEAYSAVQILLSGLYYLNIGGQDIQYSVFFFSISPDSQEEPFQKTGSAWDQIESGSAWDQIDEIR